MWESCIEKVHKYDHTFFGKCFKVSPVNSNLVSGFSSVLISLAISFEDSNVINPEIRFSMASNVTSLLKEFMLWVFWFFYWLSTLNNLSLHSQLDSASTSWLILFIVCISLLSLCVLQFRIVLSDGFHDSCHLLLAMLLSFIIILIFRGWLFRFVVWVCHLHCPTIQTFLNWHLDWYFLKIASEK